MALILNIETSTTVCSVSISKDGNLIDIREQNDGYSHSEVLSPFIDDLLKSNNLAVKNLDAIAISKGPGSYTGLRIGTSTAKGLCYALDIPLIAVSTLKSMAKNTAHNYPEIDVFAPMIDARRMEVYTALFDKDNNQIEDVYAKIIDEGSFKELLKGKKILFFGDGANKCVDVIESKNAFFDLNALASSAGMAPIAENYFNENKFVDLAYFEPFYLKDFIAGVPKVKGLK
jgi:tRNA threonylcarbamoyladenosine biosynthesis protein TsaB